MNPYLRYICNICGGEISTECRCDERSYEGADELPEFPFTAEIGGSVDDVDISENPTEPFMPVDDPDTIIFRRGEG